MFVSLTSGASQGSPPSPPGSRRWHRWRRRATAQGSPDAVDRVVAARQAGLRSTRAARTRSTAWSPRARRSSARASRAARCDRARSCDPAGGAGGGVRRARAHWRRAHPRHLPARRRARGPRARAERDAGLRARCPTPSSGPLQPDSCSTHTTTGGFDWSDFGIGAGAGVGFMLLLGIRRSRCAPWRGTSDDGVSAASAAAREGGPRARPLCSRRRPLNRARVVSAASVFPSARRGRSTSRAPPPPLLVGRTTPGSLHGQARPRGRTGSRSSPGSPPPLGEALGLVEAASVRKTFADRPPPGSASGRRSHERPPRTRGSGAPSRRSDPARR